MPSTALYTVLSLLLLRNTLPADAQTGAPAPEGQIRGLNPSLLPRYTQNSTHFQCLSSPVIVPFSSVNDDYCDCPDGSDEPGTSACEGRDVTFWCRNQGHLPGVIGTGRVNDGICDDECCDGSDEWATGACPDRCAEIGKAHRDKIEAETKIRKTGAKIRGTYVKFAQGEKKRLEDELGRLRAQVTQKEDDVAKLRVNLDTVEAQSHEQVEKRKQSALYQTLLAQRTLLTRLRARTSRLQKEVDDLHGILEDLSKGYNPNYQDMAVKAAVVGYEELTKGGAGDAEDGESAQDSEQEQEQEPGQGESEQDVSDWELDQAIGKDLEGLLLQDMESSASSSSPSADDDDTGLLYKIDEYIPDFLFDSWDTFRERLLDWMIKLGVVGKGGKVTSSGGGNDAPHVAAARTKFQDAETGLRKLQADISGSEGVLAKLSGTEYGRDGEWKKLDGTCIDKISGDYTYELCFFGSATQKSNKDHSSNHLGSFVEWNADAAAGSFEHYSQQRYRNGAKCWNGPNRSVDVELSCGTKNELLSVSEPEKCEYRFKATSPALCWPLDEVGREVPRAGQPAAAGRDEL